MMLKAKTPLLEGLPQYVFDPPIEAVVLAFGVNEDFQLGLDGREDVLSPKVVEALLGSRLCGRGFGRSPIVAGSRHTLALTAEGEVLAWGWNARATLGMGYRGPAEPKPRRIPGLKGVEIVQVALGGWHTLALDKNGEVWAWGGNEYQQAGGVAELRDVIVPTPCLPEFKVKQVAAGGMSSLALTEDGQLWQWGEPWGDFSMVIDRKPRRIDSTGDFIRVACGAFHNLAINSQGDVYTWGINDFGQLGNGTTSYATEPQRIIDGLEGVIAADVAAGGWHSIVLSTEGDVYVFGRGEWGRLGTGDKKGSSKLRPTRLEPLARMRIVEATAGGTHSIFVSDDGRAYITGRGSFGRLGTGTEQNFFSPVEVKLPGGPDRWRVISAAAGGRSSFLLALADNGDLEPDGSRTSSVKLGSRTSSVTKIATPSVFGTEISFDNNVASDEVDSAPKSEGKNGNRCDSNAYQGSQSIQQDKQNDDSLMSEALSNKLYIDRYNDIDENINVQDESFVSPEDKWHENPRSADMPIAYAADDEGEEDEEQRRDDMNIQSIDYDNEAKEEE